MKLISGPSKMLWETMLYRESKIKLFKSVSSWLNKSKISRDIKVIKGLVNLLKDRLN
jgi:hypothetical protein